MVRGKVAVGEAAPALVLCVLALTLVAGVLGGGSRENPLRLAAVELAATPLAILAIRRLILEGRVDAAAIILALAFAIPLLQLIPLPPAVWTAAPGHGDLADALEALGLPLRWAPFTLYPDATRGAVLALVPPAAMFLAVRRLSPAQRRTVAIAWLGVGVGGLALGAVQLTQPAGGFAYPYATTNVGSLVGLFANRNHEAGFLLALASLAVGLVAAAAGRPAARVVTIGAAVFAVVALMALGVVRSRAGLILAIPAVAGALAVLARGRASRRGLGLAGAVAGLAVLAVGAFASTPILARFSEPLAEEARFEAWPTVVGAAERFMPLGAGVGSFERVFRAAEPVDLVGPTFFNHAHNEYLELWLETGVVGPALLTAFAAWLGLAAWRTWVGDGDGLGRGASVAAALLLAQSVVDYPLRTETVACLFAFACGCLPARARR